MSLVRAREVRQLSQEELSQRLSQLRREYYDLDQKKEVGQLDRPHRFSHIRREIAQIMTVLEEKNTEQKHQGTRAPGHQGERK